MAVKRTRQVKQTSRRPRAATSDVLGATAAPNAPVPGKWKKQYQRLARLRNFLLDRKGDLVKDAQEEQTSFSQHMADAGTDSFDRDLALSRISSEQDAVYEIDQAMNRIRNGTYGICEMTGKPIERERLEAIPWARFSMEAEQKLEKEGAVHKARLEPPTPVIHGSREENESGGFGEDETE
ncbi:MAG TPA: TraR/DksA C4-type zinc finger protein [Verrucomicrobiae bacterium]|jgi:RNA polymerase-binding transcription factor DksA|nr:TraR/DksA C4-type zinc finger protein [Verrucomicrobiae bacterium]